MKVIGVTGNIGTGKSTVSGMLRDLGGAFLDADKVGHELLLPGSAAYPEIVATFGRGILNEKGEVERPKLGAIVFQNPEKLKQLNEIMWRRIIELSQKKWQEMGRNGARVIVFEAAVMIEAGWQSLVDELWVTSAPEDVVIKRLLVGGRFTEQQVRDRIRSQMPAAEKARYAHVVVDTNCNLAELRRRVAELWKKRGLDRL
ncbi:MAG: dephospho-CoA kinase [Chloroflexi bacterium]|nr:dephospho-CoA kinase [Chloroflexota bacterium]